MRTRAIQIAAALVLVATWGRAAVVEPIAGGSIGDGLPALEAPATAWGVAVAPNGDVYFSDWQNHRVRRIDATTGILSTVVGTGAYQSCGYAGPGTQVCVGEPRGLAFDAAGGLLVTDRLGVLLRLDPSTGLVSHVAGHQYYDPEPCAGRSGVPAVDGCVGPDDVVVDPDGAIFVVSPDFRQVQRIDPVTGILDLHAGIGNQNGEVCGDGGPATAACFAYPEGIGLDADGNVLIADRFGGSIRRVDRTTGLIDTVGGRIDGVPCIFGDGQLATETCMAPMDVLADPAGNLLFTENWYGGLREIDASTHLVSSLGPGAGAHLALDGAGNLFAATLASVTRRDAVTGEVTMVAGNGTSAYCGEGRPATESCIGHPLAVAYDGAGNLFIWDQDNLRILRVDAATGIMSTVALGADCRDPDQDPGGPCLSPEFFGRGMAADAAGNVFLTTAWGNEDLGIRSIIQRLDVATGAVSVFAGRCRTPELEGVFAEDACLAGASSLVFAPNGDLLFADGNGVRRIDATSGLVSFVVSSAELGGVFVSDLALDPAGNLFMASGDRVWRVADGTGTITRVAGNGDEPCPVPVADGQQAAQGCLRDLYAIAVDLDGDLLLSTLGTIRRVDIAAGTITTLAGRPTPPDGFDPCCDACTLPPECVRAADLAEDPAGRLVIADRDDRMVERLGPECADASGCDDGDACTEDACGAGKCAHTALSGLEGVACVCPAALDLTACAGEKIPTSVPRRFARVCHQVELVGQLGDPGRERNLLGRMRRDLRRGMRRVLRATRTGHLSFDCSQALLGQFRAPSGRLDALSGDG